MDTTPHQLAAETLYTWRFNLATLAIAEYLAGCEKDSQRQRKKAKAAERKSEALRGVYADTSSFEAAPVDPDDAIRLCIDLAFCAPFAPYDLEYSDKDFQAATSSVCYRFGLTEEAVAAIFQDKRTAVKVYQHIDLRRVAFFGAAGMAALALTGFAAAPLLGGAIGSAAGLSGIAATAHGLAFLGGGSIAAGGAGMSGGLWLVTGVGAATGALGGGSAAFIRTIGTNELKVELAKLQISYRQIEAAKLTHIAKAQEIITRLHAQREELTRALLEERELNDKNSRRLKDIEDKIAAIDATIKRMKQEPLDSQLEGQRQPAFWVSDENR